MAVGQDKLERDSQLARIYAVASSEEPPAEFDAAIQAAARRAVGAGPAVAGAPSRARRNWYVPLSLAAMLVLSVSLVTLVREEKGGDLTQAPAPASAPDQAAPPVSQAPATPSGTPDSAAMKDDRVPAMIDDKRAGGGQPAQAPAADAANTAKERAQLEQREKSVAAPVRKTVETDAVSRANVPRAEPAAPPAAAVGGATSGPSGAPAPVSPAPRREAEFVRDAASADGTRAPPPPVTASKPAQMSPAETKPSAPAIEGRVEDRSSEPERPALRSARRNAHAPGAASPSRPAWLTDLDNQPADKWLERLAEFRREARQADVDMLLAEFRRRFPDHPMSR